MYNPKKIATFANKLKRQGKSTKEIVEAINEIGIRTATDKPFNTNSLNSVLWRVKNGKIKTAKKETVTRKNKKVDPKNDTPQNDTPQYSATDLFTTQVNLARQVLRSEINDYQKVRIMRELIG